MPTIPQNPANNEVENFNRLIRKAIDIAKVKGEDYKTVVRQMLMVVRATPSDATKTSPHMAATGREMDSGIIDQKFPVVPKSGLSEDRRRQIQENLEESKRKNQEIQNRQKFRTHLNLQPGDDVLIRLENHKLPDRDTYEVINVNRNAITARNKTSGRVLTRHLSRFTRLTKQSNQPESQPCDVPVRGMEPPDPYPTSPFDGAPPLEVPNPGPLDREQEDQRAQQDRDRERRVQFNPEARAYSPRSTRQRSRETGIQPPEFPNVQPSTLERSAQQQATARQLLDQYRRDKAAARRN